MASSTTVLAILALLVCIGGGTLSIASLATANWATSDIEIYYGRGGSLEFAFGLFVGCYEVETAVYEYSNCDTIDWTGAPEDLEMQTNVVRALVIVGMVVCGIGGIVVIVAAIQDCQGGRAMHFFIAAAVALALAGTLTLLGCMVYFMVVMAELKDFLGSYVKSSGQDSDTLDRILRGTHLDDPKLSWSFYLCIVSGVVMFVAFILLLVGSSLASRRAPGANAATPGMVYTTSPPSTNFVQQPNYNYAGQPQQNVAYEPQKPAIG